jgi:ribosomal protein L40E
MPCYRCGARQVDPVRGQVSPWRRGVRADEQVLVCPGCQASGDWTADLDRCRQCGSVHLVRRLGEVECRDCGTTIPPVTEGGLPAGGAPRAAARAPGLSEEVALALERVLRRGAAR